MRTTNELQQYFQQPESLLKMDCEKVARKIQDFLRDYLSEAKCKGYIIGISGGVDSAVVAYLATDAVGKDNIYGLLLPSKYTSEESVFDGELVARNLGFKYEKTDPKQIENVLNVILKGTPKSADQNVQKIREGNIQARTRMIFLRDRARALNYLVAGTGNKSELMTGYSTVAGDGFGGVDVEPIAPLYKTQVWNLAEYLGVPKQIIEKTPSAELWLDQKDESELGISYLNLDKILLGFELQVVPKEISEILNLDIKKVNEIQNRVSANKFKTQLPPKPDTFFDVNFKRNDEKCENNSSRKKV